MQRELRREKYFRYRRITVAANAVMISPDHVVVSRINGYGLRRNCSSEDSSKRRIATTQNFCPTIAVSAVTIMVSVVIIQVYFSPCTNSSKQRSESSTRCCFWAVVSKCGTHFENNLRVPKDSYRIVNTLSSDIFKLSAISRNFHLQSPKTILWIFVMFSGTTADFRRPERSASSVFVRPRSNSAYQSMIVYFPGAEFP